MALIAFNEALEAVLAVLSVDIITIEVFALTIQLVNKPTTFGFTNVTDYCLGPTPPEIPLVIDPTGATVCENSDDYLFWDGICLPAYANEILGDAFRAAAIPESTAITRFRLELGPSVSSIKN